MRATRSIEGWALAVIAALALSGCSADGVASTAAESSSRPTPSSIAEPLGVEPEEDELSEFEQQLPLSGELVSQASATQGTVRIERRTDGSVWVVLDDFGTGESTDPRLFLKWAPLVQTADGYWVSDEEGFDIGSIDPDLAAQEIEVPGARDMPTIQSLTIMDYAPPSYPALGSAALEPTPSG